MIARLGGHLGRKHDGPPGPQSFFLGLQRMRDFVLVLDAIKNAQCIPCRTEENIVNFCVRICSLKINKINYLLTYNDEGETWGNNQPTQPRRG